MMHIDRRYMSAVFREDMLYNVADGSMCMPRWRRAGGKIAKYYPEFYVGGKRIDKSEIDGRRYVLLPRINEGLMLSEVPAWRCFNEEALARSSVDFAKYAGSEPYIYLDMSKEQSEQLFWNIAFHVADAYIFIDSRPLEEKRAFYAHMNCCFDELARHWCGMHGVSTDGLAFVWGPQSENISYEQNRDEVYINAQNRRYICGTAQPFSDYMLYSASDGEMIAPTWERGEGGGLYAAFYRQGRRIARHEIDGDYVLLPVINLGHILSEVLAWRCFSEEALSRSGVDFMKYADSSPYIYLDMAREQGEQVYEPIRRDAVRAIVFADMQPDDARDAFYARLSARFDELAREYCAANGINIHGA